MEPDEMPETESSVLGPGENCGGPLLCKNCAMNLAQKYFENGLLEWAETYRIHAQILNNNEQIKLLTEQNQALLMEKVKRQSV
jgi:hypothetical protein